jgi:hypothetical protein
VARGWESKSVEDQQAEANSRPEKIKPQLTPEQKARQQVRDGLLLSRKSVVAQLSGTQNSRHRQMLEVALSDLDRKLVALEATG